MADVQYAPKLEATRDIHLAIESIWAEIESARSALHFIVIELERDVSSAYGSKKPKHIVDASSARVWLISTAMTSVSNAVEHLSHVMNNMPGVELSK